MESIRIARATAPDLPTLVRALTPILAPAAAGGFHVRHEGGDVVIEQAHFTNVNRADVVAAVATASARTTVLDTAAAVDRMPVYLKAALLLLVDQINLLRQNPTTVYPPITPAQAWAAIKAKVETL